MSKKSLKIIDAYHLGETHKRLGCPYNNPYKKNKERNKYKAYKNGFKMAV